MKKFNDLQLGEFYVPFTKDNVNKIVPRSTGVYMLGVKLDSKEEIIPVYIGRACGQVQHLCQRSRRYLKVLYGNNGNGEVIDRLLQALNDTMCWFISWQEYSPNEAREVEYLFLKNTNLKLVNASGMGKGCQKRAINNAEEIISLYKKTNN
jgi:hypothetical protein